MTKTSYDLDAERFKEEYTDAQDVKAVAFDQVIKQLFEYRNSISLQKLESIKQALAGTN